MVCPESALVEVRKPYNIVLFILNVILPGTGTMISSCFDTEYNFLPMILGLCQLFTAPILFIGWFWSIYWGFLIYKRPDRAPRTEFI